jgi:hypothetical protein
MKKTLKFTIGFNNWNTRKRRPYVNFIWIIEQNNIIQLFLPV